MIEEMAKAAYEASPRAWPIDGQPGDWKWEMMVSEGWTMPDEYRAMVRAILTRMREPTPEMVEKVAQDIWDRREVFTLREEVALSITGYIAYWQATLDAISPPSLDSGRG